jgi:peptide/nickel transport system substrate-binding protein
VRRLVYAGLVRTGEGEEIQPDLAASWTVSNDARQYTFRLNPRATWHDGRPVTASDVLATIALLQSPERGAPTEVAAVWRLVQGEAPDPQTVELRLAEPHSGFLQACSVPILPRHVLGSGTESLAELPLSYTPVGAGPYRVGSVDAEAVTLTRYEGYAGPRPFLEEIQLRFYPDQPAALQGLATGAVDGFAGLSRAEARMLPNPERFRILASALEGHQTILLMNHRNRILRDPAVRRAISLAIARPALIDGPLGGDAAPAYGPVPSYSTAYVDLEAPPDPPRAARLLDEAGWVGSPTRSRQGAQLRLGLTVPADDHHLGLGEALGGQLQAVGFRIDVHAADPLDFYRERLIPRSYDLALMGVWLGSAAADPYPFWHSSQRQSGFNFAEYSSPEADRWLNIARADPDPGRRAEALVAFQRWWADDVPSVTLASPSMVYAVSAQVRGVRLGVTPDPGFRFQHVAEWHVATRRVPSLLKGVLG